MTLLLVRTARLLLYFALLGGSIYTLMNGMIFIADKLRGVEDAIPGKDTAAGLVIVMVSLLLDFLTRRAELQLEAPPREVRGFEVVHRDNPVNQRGGDPEV